MTIGKHIIVTGGGTGMGATVAHTLADQGFAVRRAPRARPR